jgi:hypothetical protein
MKTKREKPFRRTLPQLCIVVVLWSLVSASTEMRLLDQRYHLVYCAGGNLRLSNRQGVRISTGIEISSNFLPLYYSLSYDLYYIQG